MPRWGLHLLLCFGQLLAAEEATERFNYFITRPDIVAPIWNITVYDQDALAPGHWFVAPYANLIQKAWPLWNGPMIYASNGELIWSGAPSVEYYNTFDFRVSDVNGQEMLTYIWPKNSPEQEAGVILKDSYEVHKIVDMRGDQKRPNMHDFNLIDGGTRALMLTTPYQNPSEIHVTGEFDGPCKVDWQGFKEIDIESGDVLFEWNSEDHLGVDETTYFPGDGSDKYQQMCSTYWDITHFNAIDKFNDGDYLLSARHMDTVYKISHRDHSIVWRLGGVRNDFVFTDQRAKFTRQHHARIHSQNTTHILVSLFDNALGNYPAKASSFESWGLLLALRIDSVPMTVELVSRYQRPFLVTDYPLEKARGTVSFLPNGNAFVGWVTGSQIAEYAPGGKMLMHAEFTEPEAASYRSYKMPWVGRPSRAPDVVARAIETHSGSTSTEVYVSWNGDTETAVWNLLRTSAEGNVSELVVSAPRQGFETKLAVDGMAKYVIAVAMDSEGNEIGRSSVVAAELSLQLQSATAAEETAWLETHSSAWHPTPLETNDPVEGSYRHMFVLGALGAFACFVSISLFRRKDRWWHSRHTLYNPVHSEVEFD